MGGFGVRDFALSTLVARLRPCVRVNRLCLVVWVGFI
ncbi:hypothetical protein Vdis_0869 [Vulcanisaeta distributa DSM 14429]|uniref:Uncharacterized protein n=1 Tax=Vulcanisaeta distributa (strain DSM 14429 / JCM 11212 / NBRC 100878 / IC-017) TaxID=572478 RepID=E1QP89_VULDI|nr:hypothetical protein Vdis_0869 [Vulcanisaeta distributa DSM 14429]